MSRSMRCAGDASRLDRSQTDRTRTEDCDVGPGLEVQKALAGAESRCELIAKQRELRCREIGEHGDTVFLVHGHELADAANPRLRVHRRAVAHVGDRSEIIAAQCELTHVRAAVHALIAGTALRRPGHDDAIANDDASHLGADSFDHAEATVIRNGGTARRRGRQGTADDRVARRHCLRANDDHTRIDRAQPELLHIQPGAGADKGAKRSTRLSAGLDRWGTLALRVEARSADDSATNRRRSVLQQRAT